MVDTDKAIAMATELVEEWRSAAQCEKAILCFTRPGAPNFRKSILPTYKAGRGEKPEALLAVHAHLTAAYEAYQIDGLEADDLLGILATTLPKYGDAVVVSIDKDLKTVPGMHFNPMQDKAWRRVEQPEADYWWMMQTLIGDPVDGYKGIPGIGVKKASGILGAARDVAVMWRKVTEAFLKKGLTLDDALQQARVARILRREDYNRETKEIRLWHPSKSTWSTLTDNPSALATA